jgi:hypothetical protein
LRQVELQPSRGAQKTVIFFNWPDELYANWEVIVTNQKGQADAGQTGHGP